MKRIAPAACVLLLCSCQTISYSPPVRDYPALAAAAVGKYTIADNNVYGFTPEGKLDPSLPAQEVRKEDSWTVYRVPAKKGGFDSAELTVDGSGTIVRIQLYRTVHTAFGRQDAFNSIYQDLKSQYKAVQSLGDADTAELTVNVAADAGEWQQHYIQYLQLMDEPNNLGAQFCWILQPHLSLIQAIFHRQGDGTQLVFDCQTKMYAAALKAKAAAAKSPSSRP
jgi:hypothetical protein